MQVALGQAPSVQVFGNDYPTLDGTAVRDYIHVYDVAAAHLLALQKTGCKVYNLGSSNGFSVMQVVEAARAVTGHPVPVTCGPRRAGDPAALVADARLARKELGWRPAYPDLESMVESAWRWAKTHPRGYAQE